MPEIKDLSTPVKLDALVQTGGVGFESAGSFELLQRGATLLAKSTLVPKEYQNNIPNCTVALNMAARMGADPLMVMQNLYVVHGRPSWSAQFLIATFNQNGRFTAIRYEWVGERGTDSWGCRAYSTEKATGEKLTGSTITIALAKAERWYQRDGSKWVTMPEQMLMYRSAAWFVRAYAPEIAMGLQTAEEIEDTIIDVTPRRAEPIVVRPESMAEVIKTANLSTADVLAGQATGVDVDVEPTESGAAPAPGVFTPEATPGEGTESAAVKIRLSEIEAIAKDRVVKPAVVEHLYQKHLGTTKPADLTWNVETWVKLGRVLSELRTIQPPPAKK